MSLRDRRVNSRPTCTIKSRLDVYHQKECGGGYDSCFMGALELELIGAISFLRLR